MASPNTRAARTERGSSLIEFSVAVSLLAVALLGTIDLGRAYSDTVALAGAAHAGATYGAYRDSQAADADGIRAMVLNELAATASAEEMEALEAEVVVDSERYCSCPTGELVDCAVGTCEGGPETRRTYVRVRVDRAFATLFNYPVIPGTITLSEEAYVRAR